MRWAATSLIFVLGLFTQIALCADPADTAAPQALRTPSQVLADWQLLAEQLRGILPSTRMLADADLRKEISPAAIPLLRKTIRLNAEVYHTVRDAQPEARQKHYQFLAVLAVLGDEPSIIELKEAQSSNVREIATLSRHAWYTVRWWQAAGQEQSAADVINDLERLAGESPADDSLAALLLSFRDDGLASPAHERRLRQILGRMDSPLARAAVDQFRAAEKRASFMGKPLVVASDTLDGRPFSTRSLLGQFVLIHFGSTSSPEWQVQHNAMLQAPWPANLSIVTVLCDRRPSEVAIYFERHRPIPWAVLRPGEDPAAFAAQYGIEDLPNTILLDPAGNVIATDIPPSTEGIAGLTAPTSTGTTK